MNWDETYRQTALEDLPWYPGEIDELLRDAVYSGWLRGRAALDIGAGQATDAIYLAANGYDVTCLDVSPAARELALREAEAAFVELDYVIGNALDLPFADNSFDVVLDRGCFQQLLPADRPRYIAELTRVMKQGAIYFYRNFTAAEMAKQMPAVPAPDRLSEAVIRQLFEPELQIVQFGTYLAKGRAGRTAAEMHYAVMRA